MRIKTLLIFVAAVAVATALFVVPAAAWQKKKPRSDPISGEWNTSLVAAGNATFTLMLKLKLEGEKVAGSYESTHIGSSKISKGTRTANKLSLTLESNHGSITLAGELKQGKLSGKFNSGPKLGTWQASKK